MSFILAFYFHQVHVAGAGDFQLCKIEILKDPVPLNPRIEQDSMDTQDEEVTNVIFARAK